MSDDEQAARTRWVPWRVAMDRALYGPRGFYRAGPGAGRSFRTSVSVSPQYAQAVARLAGQVDDLLDHPDPLDVVDVGAGQGALLRHLAPALPAPVRARARLVAVDVRARPADLPAEVAWAQVVPPDLTGLLVANELLDNVPLDVAMLASGGLRLVEVDPASGAERAGDPLADEDAAWVARWWPLDDAEQGDRVEIGTSRDRAWASLVARLRAGVAVAMDYGHVRAERATGRFAAGTLAGYRGGRAVPPVPDGTCDITAHVALDACLAAGVEAAGVRAGAGPAAESTAALTDQRRALRALGVDAARPPIDLARSDPHGYLAALARAGTAAELIDSSGLGGFGWLAQSVRIPLPASLRL